MPGIDSSSARPPIAIVGLSCRFAGDASNPSKFWDLLKSGRDAYSPTTDRYNAQAFHDVAGKKNRQNLIPTTGGYFLQQDPYLFDAAFFNITAAEAMALDPKQRLALEVAYEALENAGMPLQKVSGTQTACFMGTAMSDYRDAVSRDFAQYPKYHLLGVNEEIVSNRISHFLDIHGPSATIQTACSSSHVATHLACQALQSGEADIALAGGVGLVLSPESTMHLNNLGFLSPFGKSRTFDEHAAGYGRGEGCGVLVLKRLDKAVQDGDNIRAVIRASAVDSDGWTQGITMPSMTAQAALIKHVYESNGLDYTATQYVEAHGTGTKAGDPVETEAIYRTIVQGAEEYSTLTRQKLWVGSVKPNIGHLEPASGVASIIKGVLAMEHGIIPPNIHLCKVNPDIHLEKWKMEVPLKPTPWPVCQTKRMSVSGFGMGGTNAHLVLEEHKKKAFAQHTVDLVDRGQKRLFVFSSHDQAGLKRVSQSFVEHLDALGPAASSSEFLANLAHTLSTARSGFSWKDTCVAGNTIELREQLSKSLGDTAARGWSGKHPPRIGFVFTGQGAQWARMGIELLERRIFRESVAKSTQYLKEMGCDWDPVAELHKAPTESRAGESEVSQPICSVLQIALVDELRSWGVYPSKVVGHSSGEIAAAYSIGALSHRDALAVAFFRGKVSKGLTSLNGGMMAVGCTPELAQEIFIERNLQATVACVNSPASITLSGNAEVLDKLQTVFDERSIFARRLKVGVAYHSPHMLPASGEYAASIADVEPGSATVRESLPPATMISSVTSGEVDPELLGPYYWVRNLISPVMFANALKELVCPASQKHGDKTIDLLIEVGPHGALGGPVEQILSHHKIAKVSYQSMLTRNRDATETTMDLAAKLFRHGVPIKIAQVNDDLNPRLLTDLPPYPWNHNQKFRVESRVQRELFYQSVPRRSLLGAPLPKFDEQERTWQGFIRLEEEPWLRDHCVGNTVLFPGAGMVSMVLEAAQQLLEPSKVCYALRLRDIAFLASMPLNSDAATEVIVKLQPHLLATSGNASSSWWEFTLSSCIGTASQLRINCQGLLAMDYEAQRSQHIEREDRNIEGVEIANYKRIHSECSQTCSKEEFYKKMAESALQYGETFQGVLNCNPGPGKTTFDVEVIDIGETLSRDQIDRPFLVHAGTLDSVFQGTLGSTGIKNNAMVGFSNPVLPVSIGELKISLAIPGDVGYRMPCLCRSEKRGFNELSADLTVFDKDLSRVFLSVKDFRMVEIDITDLGLSQDNGSNQALDPARITSEPRWNYALEFLDAPELNELLDSTTETQGEDALVELIQIVIHHLPSTNVIELVPDYECLSGAVTNKLDRNTIHADHVHLAVASLGHKDAHALSPDNADSFGTTFDLGAVDTPLSSGAGAADLLVVPVQACEKLGSELEKVMNRLIGLAKPDAMLIVSAPPGANWEDRLLPALTGFHVHATVTGSTHRPTIHLLRSERTEQSETKLTNGSLNKGHAVIIEPSSPSIRARSLSEKMQKALQGFGHSTSTVEGISGVNKTQSEPTTYISLLELEQPILDKLSETDFEDIRDLTLKAKRILWITGNGNPAFELVSGFLRVINAEIPQGRFQALHLSDDSGWDHAPSLATPILQTKSKDNEFREKDGKLQVCRIYSSAQEDEHIREHLNDSIRMRSLTALDQCQGPTSLVLDIGKPGLLDTLHFTPDDGPREPLGDHEVEIQVKAAGVNFRDVMGAMGLVPLHGLGQEASGVVLRMGSQAAAKFKPGDRVCTISLGGTYATRARCDARITQKMPESMSFEEAAAVPVIHATVYYALVKLARLRRGQSVLIHAAAGGVGQAAVQLATHLGLVIYVTVGTEDKRQLVMEQYGIPEDHIFHSRDGSFVKSVMRATAGRGVDCVLNSLSGELLRLSWGCVATFGTFVEIGLRDITDNTRLDMRPFGNSTTFTFINLHTLISDDPGTLGEILHETLRLVGDGILRTPSPTTVYPLHQVEDVFRIMQQGRHRGKMVLSFTQDQARAPVLCLAKDSLQLDPEATYLIVGGLGGLGRSLALEFVASGARHLAFISRSGANKPEAEATVQALRSQGAQVMVYRADIAHEESFLAAMDQCSRDLPPIRGVVHMAMVLRDIIFEKMSYADWTVPLGPKVQGSWNIHQYFGHERPLDFIIFCSSTAGVCGNASQAQYAAGNTYQDALARHRRTLGLKATAINLGIMRDVGVLAETGSHSLKQWETVLGIREPAFHALMKSLINSQLQRRSQQDLHYPAQLSVGLGTSDILALHSLPPPPYFDDVRFAPLSVTRSSLESAGGTASAGDGDAPLAAQLAEAANAPDPVAAAATIITEALVRKTAEILRIPHSEIEKERPMYQYGVDSLVALEVRNWISKEMKANMPMLEILSAVPMSELAVSIAKKSTLVVGMASG